VALESVGDGLQEHGAIARSDTVNGLLSGLTHRHDVHPVYLHGWDVVGVGRRVQIAASGVGTVDVAAHAVEVVFQHEDDRQVPQRREVERLVELALVHRSVTEETHYDPVLAHLAYC